MELKHIEERLELLQNWISNLVHCKINHAFGGNMATCTFDEFLYFTGRDELVFESADFIPKMVHPLGKYWNQPYLSNIRLRGDFAVMNKYCFDLLSEYSSTFPTGAYEGKMWKRKVEDGWRLVWYGKHPDPDMVSINHKQIKIEEANYLYMYDTERTLIIEGQVEDFQYYVRLQKQQQDQLIKAKFNNK